jgi:hypothetical protein
LNEQHKRLFWTTYFKHRHKQYTTNKTKDANGRTVYGAIWMFDDKEPFLHYGSYLEDQIEVMIDALKRYMREEVG